MAIQHLFRKLLNQPTVDTHKAATDTQEAAQAAKSKGDAFRRAGDHEHATECYREALRILPTYAEACVNFGLLLKTLGRHKEAEELFLRAEHLKPTLWQARFNLGLLAEETNRREDAITHYQHVLGLHPPYMETASWPEVHWRLANIYASQERYAEALPLAEAVVAHDPSWTEMQLNTGVTLSKLGRHEEALSRYKQVVTIEPENVRATHLLGTAYQALHDWGEAQACYARVLALDPGNPDVKMDLALLLLLLGDYANGWALHEKALPDVHRNNPDVDSQIFRRTFKPEKYWHGEALDGKALLIWTEQGLGDTLMLIRYLPMIRALGVGEIRVCCEAPLVRIVAALPEVTETIPKQKANTSIKFDRHCSILSLPFVCGSRLDNLPLPPYIIIPEVQQLRWKERLSSLPGLKVGLAWGGNRMLPKDRQRSIPLAEFQPLFDLPGITWINLQKGEPAAQLKEIETPLIDWMDQCQDFQDTGALMEALDLIISVDTSIIHLAGALGRPAWLLNRHESEWRWLLDREDSPWYPSLRIIRQPAANDWNSVIARVASDLQVRLAG